MSAKIMPTERALDELAGEIVSTPREACVAMIAGHLRDGLGFDRLLSAVYLAALLKRNSHHEVFLVHAAHEMSLTCRPDDRLLPLFWAVDVFKRQQEQFPAAQLGPLEGSLPPYDQAAERFDEAMRSFDGPAAERAAVVLAANEGSRATMQRFWAYAPRDWGFIGHRAIAVANCWRFLDALGWPPAEATLRFLVRTLCEGGSEDKTFRANLERAASFADKLSDSWQHTTPNDAATLEMLELIREAELDALSQAICELLASGAIDAGPVWDAIHLGAAEMMIRHRHGGYQGGQGLNTRPLHSNTAANALRFGFRTADTPQQRLLHLLQAASWVSEFTRVERDRGNLRDLRVTALAGADVSSQASDAVEQIFARLPARAYDDVIDNRAPQDEAARLAFAYASRFPKTDEFLATSRRLVCAKATVDAHDYKYPIAMFEDLTLVSPTWRPHLIAATVHWLPSSRSPDSPVTLLARETLQ